MATTTLEQFIRFSTDAVGLERMLRGVQALLQILISYPWLLSLVLSLAAFARGVWGGTATGVSAPPPGYPSAQEVARTEAVLAAVRGRVNLVRRFFRAFRFLESFHAAHALYDSVYAAPAPTVAPTATEKTEQVKPPALKKRSTIAQAELWLDILRHTFNGMYLLLEASTLPDALGVEDLEAWGPARAAAVGVEAQRFWFLALACGVASGLLKLLRVAAQTPLPEVPEASAEEEKTSAEKGEEGKEEEDENEKADWQKERERLRRVVKARKEQRVAWRRAVRARSKKLGRRLLADALDLVLPGSVVGWIRAEAGTVGVAMLGSTVLTGLEVWERVGAELGRA